MKRQSLGFTLFLSFLKYICPVLLISLPWAVCLLASETQKRILRGAIRNLSVSTFHQTHPASHLVFLVCQKKEVAKGCKFLRSLLAVRRNHLHVLPHIPRYEAINVSFPLSAKCCWPDKRVAVAFLYHWEELLPWLDCSALLGLLNCPSMLFMVY